MPRWWCIRLLDEFLPHRSQYSDTWEAEYHTTADFGFCPCCGRFDENDHWDGGEAGYNSGYSCGEFATFTTDELLKKINSPEAEEDGVYWEFE
jgi:hypothetical protein